MIKTTIYNIARTLGVAALITGAAIGQSQSPSAATSKPASASDSASIQRITLPKVPTEIPPGPNLQVYEKNCLICHSARYVLTQPRFPKTVWQSEVKKMVDAYGATIPEADQALIVEYLVAVKGTEAAGNAAAPKK